MKIRRLLLFGRVREAEVILDGLELGSAPPRLLTVAALVRADLASRRLDTRSAERALAQARDAARAARIPALAREVEQAAMRLEAPVARLVTREEERAIRLGEVEALLGSGRLVVDACRRELRAGSLAVSLLRRPVLFALALALGAEAPHEVSRSALIGSVFGVKRFDETHRARLRVELGRLRTALWPTGPGTGHEERLCAGAARR